MELALGPLLPDILAHLDLQQAMRTRTVCRSWSQILVNYANLSIHPLAYPQGIRLSAVTSLMVYRFAHVDLSRFTALQKLVLIHGFGPCLESDSTKLMESTSVEQAFVWTLDAACCTQIPFALLALPVALRLEKLVLGTVQCGFPSFWELVQGLPMLIDLAITCPNRADWLPPQPTQLRHLALVGSSPASLELNAGFSTAFPLLDRLSIASIQLIVSTQRVRLSSVSTLICRDLFSVDPNWVGQLLELCPNMQQFQVDSGHGRFRLVSLSLLLLEKLGGLNKLHYSCLMCDHIPTGIFLGCTHLSELALVLAPRPMATILQMFAVELETWNSLRSLSLAVCAQRGDEYRPTFDARCPPVQLQILRLQDLALVQWRKARLPLLRSLDLRTALNSKSEEGEIRSHFRNCFVQFD